MILKGYPDVRDRVKTMIEAADLTNHPENWGEYQHGL